MSVPSSLFLRFVNWSLWLEISKSTITHLILGFPMPPILIISPSPYLFVSTQDLLTSSFRYFSLLYCTVIHFLFISPSIASFSFFFACLLVFSFIVWFSTFSFSYFSSSWSTFILFIFFIRALLYLMLTCFSIFVIFLSITTVFLILVLECPPSHNTCTSHPLLFSVWTSTT